jgi:hypothetical protein
MKRKKIGEKERIAFGNKILARYQELSAQMARIKRSKKFNLESYLKLYDSIKYIADYFLTGKAHPLYNEIANRRVEIIDEYNELERHLVSKLTKVA